MVELAKRLSVADNHNSQSLCNKSPMFGKEEKKKKNRIINTI